MPEDRSGRIDIANDSIPNTTPAGATGEIEVLGISEELPYKGYN